MLKYSSTTSSKKKQIITYFKRNPLKILENLHKLSKCIQFVQYARNRNSLVVTHVTIVKRIEMVKKKKKNEERTTGLGETRLSIIVFPIKRFEQ